MQEITIGRADAAVAAIWERYGDMVYAAALRQTRDHALAEDVMQAVSMVLLTKVRQGKGPAEGQLAGWLLRVTAYVVKETRRASWRRKRRELAAMAEVVMHDQQADVEIRESLDAALMTLGAMDREVVARRYLRGESVEVVGAAVGLTENATSKRIGRALEKLRKALGRTGVSVPLGAVMGVLVEEAARKLPVAVGGEIAARGKVGAALARRVLWRWMMKQVAVVVGAVAAVCIGAVSVGVVWHFVAAGGVVAAQKQDTHERLLHVGAVLEETSDRLVAQILNGIEENRKKLKTIEIEATQTWLDPNFSLVESEPTVGKGWIETASPRRFRVEISLERSPWNDGPQPYVDYSFSEAWDGEKLRILYGQPNSEVRGEITSQETLGEGQGVLGTRYSMQLMRDDGFSGDVEIKQDPLDPVRLRQMALAGRRVMMNGREAMELEVRFSKATVARGKKKGGHYVEIGRVSKRYWFDASRGYALVGYDYGLDSVKPLGEREILEERVIDELTEAAPGVFYPARAREISYSRNGKTEEITFSGSGEFVATRVVANQAIDPAMFRIEFPEGVAVTERAPSSQPATQPATQP